MSISGPSSYGPTALEILAHWEQCNGVLPPAAPLLVRRPNNTSVTRGQFSTLYESLVAQQSVLQDRRLDLTLIRGTLHLQKVAMLDRFNQFTTSLEAFWQNTPFLMARPLAPSLTWGKQAFTDPLGDAMKLWQKMNVATPPAGFTLPLTLKDNYPHSQFASDLSSLFFTYAEDKNIDQDVTLERAKRTFIEFDLYEIMKAYREVVPKRLEAFPALVATMPRLTPLPGHTPDAVNASAIFEAPDKSKVIYDASTDPTLHVYQLRGNVGDEYSDEDAQVIATNEPGAPREFLVPFGLNQPGARVALKVYVVLNTGNEAGSAAMFVQRPFAVVA